jgi:hypothetical protein
VGDPDVALVVGVIVAFFVAVSMTAAPETTAAVQSYSEFMVDVRAQDGGGDLG